MSDIKPKRPMRTTSASEIALGEAMPAASTPSVTPELAAAEPAPAIEVAAVAALPAASATAADRPEVAVGDAWCALTETQAAFARSFEQAAVELTGMSQSAFSAASNAAIALLGARTLAEAVEINAGLAQRGVDALIEASARLSEIGIKATADASRPIFTRLGASGGITTV